MYNLNSIFSQNSLNEINNIFNNIDANTKQLEIKDSKEDIDGIISNIYEDMKERTSHISFVNDSKRMINVEKGQGFSHCTVTAIGLNAECKILNMYDTSLIDIMYRLLEFNDCIQVISYQSQINLDKVNDFEACLLNKLFTLCNTKQNVCITRLKLDCINGIIKRYKKTMYEKKNYPNTGKGYSI